MLGGRLVWGLVSLVLYGLSGSSFTWQMFAAGAFLNALPGIVFQLLAIPLIMFWPAEGWHFACARKGAPVGHGAENLRIMGKGPFGVIDNIGEKYV